MTEASNPVPPQNTNTPPPPEQHVIASPNPTIDDSKTTATVEPGKVSGTKVRPAHTSTNAPMKKKKATRHKRKHTRTQD